MPARSVPTSLSRRRAVRADPRAGWGAGCRRIGVEDGGGPELRTAERLDCDAGWPHLPGERGVAQVTLLARGPVPHRGPHSGQTWAGSRCSLRSTRRPDARRTGRNRIPQAASTLPRLSVPRCVSWSPAERTNQVIDESSISEQGSSTCTTCRGHARVPPSPRGARQRRTGRRNDPGGPGPRRTHPVSARARRACGRRPARSCDPVWSRAPGGPCCGAYPPAGICLTCPIACTDRARPAAGSAVVGQLNRRPAGDLAAVAGGHRARELPGGARLAGRPGGLVVQHGPGQPPVAAHGLEPAGVIA